MGEERWACFVLCCYCFPCCINCVCFLTFPYNKICTRWHHCMVVLLSVVLYDTPIIRVINQRALMLYIRNIGNDLSSRHVISGQQKCALVRKQPVNAVWNVSNYPQHWKNDTRKGTRITGARVVWVYSTVDSDGVIMKARGRVSIEVFF